MTSNLFRLQPELRNACGQVSIVVVLEECTMLRCSTYITMRSEILFWLWGWLELSVGVRKTVKIQSISRRIKIQESAHCHHCLTEEQQLHLMWGSVHVTHADPGRCCVSVQTRWWAQCVSWHFWCFMTLRHPGKRQQLSSCDICYLRHKTFIVVLHCPHTVVTPFSWLWCHSSTPLGNFKPWLLVRSQWNVFWPQARKFVFIQKGLRLLGGWMYQYKRSTVFFPSLSSLEEFSFPSLESNNSVGQANKWIIALSWCWLRWKCDKCWWLPRLLEEQGHARHHVCVNYMWGSGYLCQSD